MAALQGMQRTQTIGLNHLGCPPCLVQPRAKSRSRCAVLRASGNGLTGCRLLGVGSSAPATVLSNQDLERFVDTNDEWITTRTGIKRRHILGEDESMAQHAAKACQQALDMAGVSADLVDMVLLATSTPDDAFGSACQVCLDAWDYAGRRISNIE